MIDRLWCLQDAAHDSLLDVRRRLYVHGRRTGASW